MRLEAWFIRGGPFHFGQQAGLGMEASRITWPSDSLFAALVARLAAQEGGQVAPWLQPFVHRDPPFLLTSTFPGVQARDGGVVWLFPVPLGRRSSDPLPPGVQPKDLKRVRFVSEGLYRRLLQGQTLARLFPQAQRAGHGSLWFAPQDWQRLPRAWQAEGEALALWKVTKRPRVTVGRLTGRSNLFHVAAVHFRPPAGLWFGVLWRDPHSPWKARLPGLLSDLAEAGLGAERNVGYGRATIEPVGSLTLPDPTPGGWWTTLSRYWPQPHEMDALRAPGAAYEIVPVAGWLDQHGQRRRPVHMLAEAAVLGEPASAARPFGALAEVQPVYAVAGTEQRPVGHPVYRYGYALAVGFGGAP